MPREQSSFSESQEQDEYEERAPLNKVGVLGKSVCRGDKFRFTTGGGEVTEGAVEEIYKVVFHFLNQKRQRRKRDTGTFIEISGGETLDVSDIVKLERL